MTYDCMIEDIKVYNKRKTMCKGCKTHDSGTTLLEQGMSAPICMSSPHMDLNTTCPCSVCLIKGVCNEICDEFSFYLNLVYGIYNG